jgi:hypothetical protein
MWHLIFPRAMNVIKFILFLLLLAVCAQPGYSDAPDHGAPVATFIKNKVEYEVLSFDRLFFKYQPPTDVEHADGTITKSSGKPIPIPPEIKALNGKRVAVRGFVIPLETDGKNIKTFLFADQLLTCLFCMGLGYDQWIMGTAVNGKGFHLSDEQYEEAMTVYGILEIGERYQEGQLESIYRIKAEGLQSQKKKVFGLF